MLIHSGKCWVLVALRLAPIPRVVPSGPLGASPDPPAVPSGPRGVPVPPSPFGVPPYPPACPPVPLVSRGSWVLQVLQLQRHSGINILDFSAARGRCALYWFLAARCPLAP
jgi:hypothetical protein